MQNGRNVEELIERRKYWKCSQTLSFMLSCYITLCILASTLQVVLSSERFQGLDQNPTNPGIGVNYYGKIQKTKRKTIGNGMTYLEIFDDFKPRDCSKIPKGTSCIQRDALFQDPAFIYSIFHQVNCHLSYKYRNFDGTCISPHISILGMANDCFFRFTSPYYDGFGGFRKSVNGNPLPEPRDISLKIFQDRHNPEENLSFQFLVFGQLVAHDMSRAVQPQTDCCAPENADKEECAPISVRPDDPFYSQFQKTCIDFQRSDLCTLGKMKNREQRNAVTAAIDLSFIYGNNESAVNNLRTMNGTARLKTIGSGKNSIMPSGKDPEDIFCPRSRESKCFFSGDPRVNQHSSMTALHTVWVREHNRIAMELRRLNPQWDESKLFQETRKILIAEFQCITYQDFLPILLTPRIMKEFDMIIKKGTKGTLYYPIAVIAVWHEFSHAAFRLHNMVPKNIDSLNLRFKDTFLNPDLIRKGLTSDLIKGSQHVPIEKIDCNIIEDLTDYLYQEPGVFYGNDLAAINIQRGRDHGIGPYVDIVKFCTEFTINITSFDDLVELDIMPEESVQLLEELYESVEDVDMWVGMQLENHMPGTFLGPSAVCVCAKQFFFTQKGDRLFFNHEGLLGPFKPRQRNEIKKVSLGRILCDNTDITHVPNNTFLLPSDSNPMVPCDQIPKVDLSLWKNN